MATFSVTVSAYNANAPYSSSDTVTLADTGANIAALSAVAFGNLAADGIDKINATDNILSLSVAQYQALGAVTLAAGDVVTLADTGANIATLSATDIAALADAGIDRIDATDNALNLTVAQFQALGTVALTAGDTVTLVGSGATLSALTATQIAALAAAGVDQLDATNNVLSLTLAQYQALGTVTVAANDVLTLSGTGTSIGALSVAQIAGLAGSGFDKINATDDALTLSVAQFQALGTVELVAGDVVTLADSGAAIAALSNDAFAALADAGIDRIDASDNLLGLTVAQVQRLGTVELASGDVVTLADTGAAIAALAASDIAALGTIGVDRIDAGNDTLSLTVDQAQALGNVALTAGDVVTLADTGANLAALTTGQIAALASAGFDAIDATDGSLTLSLAQIDALGTMALTAGNTVIAQATVAEIEALSPARLAALAAAGVDLLGPTDGEPMLSVAQGQALVANNLWLTGSTAVLADTGAAIAAVGGTTLEDLYLHGVTRIDAIDDVLALSVDQALAVDDSGATLTGGDVVTLADSGATLATLSTGAIGDLALLGVDRIDASDNTLDLTVAQYQALDSIVLTQADSVTLADTAANLQALSAGEIAALASAGIDTLHATDGPLALTTAQALALGGVALVGSDTVILSDTAAPIQALSAGELATLASAGVDRIFASDGSLSLSVAQAQALGSIALTAANAVTLADSGATLAALSAPELAALANAGIDAIDADDDTLILTVAQAQALASVTLAAGDTITLADTGAELAALGTAALADLATRGFDGIDATDDALTLSLEQLAALGNLTLAAGDLVTVVGSGAQFAALTAQDFADLAAAGVDALATTDHALSLTVEQLQSLGGLALASNDTITLADSAANIQALDADDLAALAGLGIDTIHATDGALVLTAAQAVALGAVTLAAQDSTTLVDSAAGIEALAPAQIATLADAGLDRIDSTDDSLALTVAQVEALGPITLAGSDAVTLADSGAHIAALASTVLANLGLTGIDTIDATDNALTLSVAQLDALGDVQIAAGDTLTLADSGATLAALSTAALTALVDRGIDTIDATDNELTLSLAQARALSGVAFTGADLVTVVATGAEFAAFAAQDFAALAAAGVDALAPSDHALSLSVAQIQALDGVALAGVDTITLADGSATIAALSAATLADLVDRGVDRVAFTDATGEWDAAHALALAGATIADDSTLTVLDSAATLEALSPAQWATLAAIGTHAFATDTQALTLDTEQALAIGDMVPANGNTLVIEDDGATVSGLTAAQLAAFAAKGSVVLYVPDDGLVFTKAQIEASAGIQLVDDSGATLADSASVLNALTPMQIAHLLDYPFTTVEVAQGTLAWTWDQLDALGNGTIAAGSDATLITAQSELDGASLQTLAGLYATGIDTLASDTGTLQVNLDQLDALGNVVLAAGDTVTLADSGVALGGLSTGALGDLAAHGIDAIAVTDTALSLTLQQLDALGSVRVSEQATLILADAGINLNALDAAMIPALHDRGVDAIDATDNLLLLGLDAFRALDGIAFTGDDTILLQDDAAALSTLTEADLARLADAGIGLIVADNEPMVVTVAQYAALREIDVNGASFVVADTGAALAALSTADFAAAGQNGVYRIDATDNLLTLSHAQFAALHDTIALTAGDTVTLVLSPTQLAALAPADLADLAGAGVDILAGNATGLTLSLAHYQALDGITLDAASDFTLMLTPTQLAELTPAEIADLASHGIDAVTLGNASATIDLAQALALVDANFSSGPILVADSAAHLSGLSLTDIAALGTLGVSQILVSDDAIGLDLAHLDALRLADIALASGGGITLADTAATLGNLAREAIDALAEQGVTTLHATDTALALPVETWSRLVQDGIGFTPGDSVVVTDSGSALAVLGEETLATLADSGVTGIDATDDHLTLSFTQFQALGAVALTPADTVTLWFNGDALADLPVEDIAALADAGVDQVGTLGEPLHVDLATLGRLADGGLAIDPAVTVRATASAGQLGGLTPSDFAALQDQGVDILQVNGALSLSVAQYAALGSMELAGHDGRVVTDTGANIAALSPAALESLAARGVGMVDATDGTLHLSLAQVSAMGEMYVAYEDLAVVDLTAQQAATLDNATRAILGRHGIDAIAITEGTLTLGLADLSRYADYTFVGGNVVLAESGATLGGLAPSDLAWLGGRGISAIDAQDDTLTLSLAQFTALGDIHLAAADDVTITASAAQLAALSPAVFAAMDASGVDAVEISDGALNLTAAQAAQLGSIQLTGSGPITLVDSGAAIAALGVDAIAGLAGSGVTGIDATTSVTINASKYEALGGIRFALSDVVTVASNHSFTMDADVDNVTLSGTKNLVVTGNSGANVITGNAGRNTLDGGAGNDRLIGGAGRDVLTGGAGADKFIFRDGDFGGNTATTADRITDFSRGSKDMISLIGVDANATTPGDDAFAWIGTSGFHHVAGELRYTQAAGNTYVQGDTNGDGLSDFWIRLDGVVNLQATDFQL